MDTHVAATHDDTNGMAAFVAGLHDQDVPAAMIAGIKLPRPARP